MKKTLALLLVLCLCAAPALGAQTEENVDGLIRVLASVDGAFDGAPDPALAWAALSVAANETDQTEWSYDDVKELYDSLYANDGFAAISDAPEELFVSDENGGYALESAAGEPATMVSINALNDNGDGTLDVDFSAWQDVHGGCDDFRCNGMAVVVKDARSRFGYRAISYVSDDMPITAFADAEAEDVLANQYDFSYAPENAVDGDLSTCWAYTGSDACPALTLYANATQKVRGIAITAGYAKNEDIFGKNCRIRELEVTFSDGTEKTFALDEVELFDGMRVLPFDGIVVTDSITIRVTQVYPGSKYDDVCVSEILIF